MELSENLKRLTRMMGIESIQNAMDWEQREVEKATEFDRATLGGGDPDATEASESEMRMLVAGDLTMNQAPKDQPAPGPIPSGPNKSSTLAKVATAAALVAGGAGAMAVVDKMTTPTTDRPPMVDTNTDMDVQLPD